MAFRKKNKNRAINNIKQTIDSLHKEKLDLFKFNQQNLITLKNELANLKKEKEQYIIDNPDTGCIPNLQVEHTIREYETKIENISNQIEKISNKEDEKTYLLQTGKIINKYYKLLDNEKELTELKSTLDFDNGNILSMLDMPIEGEQVEKIKPKKKKDVLDWFKSDVPSSGIYQNLEDTNKEVIMMNKRKEEVENTLSKEELKKVDRIQYLMKNKKDKKLNKQKIYDDYMKITCENYISSKEDETDLFDTCFQCHNEMVLNHNTGMLNCNSCGMTEKIIVDSDKQSHKEPPKEMTSFSYKRINHLNEILSQFQAKETTEIPEEIYNKILIELKKERIENMALLTKEKLREILKKINETDYYDHIPYIINQLNGLPPPSISPEVENIIRGLFLQLQHPFNLFCPEDRKNFLTYGYTLYKIFELLELDEYLCNFNFLKDRKKLYEQEQIWKKICNELKWEFIPSI